MEHRATHARKDYEQGSLDETTVARDPVRQFAAWYDAAVAAGVLEPLREDARRVDARPAVAGAQRLPQLDDVRVPVHVRRLAGQARGLDHAHRRRERALQLGREPLAPELHARTLVLHGEQDDTVALASVMDWARPQSLPVTVIPGVEHFFHGQLPLLKSLVLRHLLAPVAP